MEIMEAVSKNLSPTPKTASIQNLSEYLLTNICNYPLNHPTCHKKQMALTPLRTSY